MRFVADVAISPKTIAFLQELGHEAVHVRTLGLQRARDHEVIELARSTDSVVLAFDLDFGDILALGVLDRPSVVLFRLTDERPDAVNRRLAVVLSEQRHELESGALILVENNRYRVRRLPITPLK